MRGKGIVYVFVPEKLGITPACAGKRRVVPDCNAVRWDHPRVCGEKFNCNPGSPQHWGSPPRMRGKDVP